MVYLSWEALSLLLSKSRVNKKRATLFLMLFLWILMAIRSIYMGVNDTSGVYLSGFLKCQIYSLQDALYEKIFINEPLMTSFTWVCSRIMSYQMYIALYSLLPILSFYSFICKNTIKPIYGVIVFFTFFYFYQSYLLKQMLALSVVLYAFDSLKQKKFIKYIMIIIFAGLIHKSAFILIPVYFLCKYIKFNKYFFVFTIAGMMFGMFFGQYILDILYKMSFYNFESYIKNGIYGLNGKINLSMFIYIFLTFFCYFFAKRYKKIEEYNDYLVFMFFGCVLNSWSTVVVEFYRMALYFICPVCVLLPESLENIPRKYKSVTTVIVISFLFLYAFKIAINCNCLPYHTFLSD